MKTGAAGVMAVVLACTCAASPPPVPAPAAVVPPATKPAAPVDYCGAGHLPRVTDKSFAEGGVLAFLADAAKGTVAVVWDGKSARVIDRCRLDGRYVEAKGNGDWRFRATNRVLFRTDEISSECRTATHLVAAYITRTSAPQTGGAISASQMNGILVPLPCPPAKDLEPAPGCIARGLTGTARRKKADVLMTEVSSKELQTADVAKVLGVFALIPDKYWGVTYASHLYGGDCPLARQGEWLASQYTGSSTEDMEELPSVVELLDAARRPPPPKLDWHGSNFNCVRRPVFLQCFPGQFEPIFGGPGYWTPVEPEKP